MVAVANLYGSESSVSELGARNPDYGIKLDYIPRVKLQSELFRMIITTAGLVERLSPKRRVWAVMRCGL